MLGSTGVGLALPVFPAAPHPARHALSRTERHFEAALKVMDELLQAGKATVTPGRRELLRARRSAPAVGARMRWAGGGLLPGRRGDG